MTGAGRNEGQAGFTLVEMLVVLAILAIVSGASGLAIARGGDARLVASTVDRLLADLQRTRIDAMRSGRPRSLAFDMAARYWRRDAAEPVSIPAGVALDLTTAREADGRGGETSAAIAFLPGGRSTGGRIEIVAGAAQGAIVVDWLTGAVREVEP